MTRMFGVIGDPIAHSLSPLIHRGWIREHGLDADYRALRVGADDLGDAMATFTRQGIRGLNVTLPHKQAVIAHCDAVSPLAQQIGAVNTLSRTADGGWRGDNTDHDGFTDALDGLLGRSPHGMHVRVLGAGGAARAVVLALHHAGADISLANRTREHAQGLVDSLGLNDIEILSLQDGLDQMQTVDLVVNALSLGHQASHLALPEGAGRLFYDISYGPAARAVLEPARARGWATVDGLGMLVAQAARSFEIWFSTRPDTQTAQERCRTAVEAI